MGKNKKIEVFGTLAKRETLFAIKDKIVPGSLVLESLKPFPGYYSEIPNATTPLYIYIGVDKSYDVLDIARAYQNISENTGWTFEAAKACVSIYNYHYNVIRLRHLESYDMVVKIQEAFAREGILPLNLNWKWGEESTQIQLTKFFCFEKQAKGIYLDCSEENHGYFIMPKHLTWEEFNEVTRRVKYNWDGSHFDAAVGTFYRKGRVREVVRVYSSKVYNMSYLDELYKLYLAKVK